jgi:aminoglycoside phosphotransferase (APT) family kinase protein
VTGAAVGELPARVRDAVRRRWPEARTGDLQPLHGGISSLTFSATLSDSGLPDRPVVVKVAPPGLAPVRNRDVLRQARVMKAVHGAAGVRVPAVLAEDDATPPFFVMEFIEGESYEPRWDVSPTPPAPSVVDARARAAARMLARLQAVDPATVELAAEPALSPSQELDRWAQLYATAGDDLRGDERSLADALADRVPAPAAGALERPAILHGDYRLGNLQFAGDRLAAIIDWEIWSLGDPRHDLAWLMVFTDPVQQRVQRRDAANQAAADAMPAAQDLLSEYLQEAGLTDPPPDLAWFQALCYYKLGATMSVLAKRNRRAAEPDPGLELAAETTPAMLARALKLLVQPGGLGD